MEILSKNMFLFIFPLESKTFFWVKSISWVDMLIHFMFA